MSKKLTTEEFIKKAREVHGDKYDYSKTVYTGSNDYVTITCPIHGDFKQTPHKHLYGGCRDCGIERRSESRRSNTEEFIEKAKKVHENDNYDYSKVEYIDASTEIIIGCPIHGDFKIDPNHFLSGRGCKKCGIERRNDTVRSNTEEFIEKAKKIHGNTYGYNNVEYVDNRTPVLIECPIHGLFKQPPHEHLRGHGCNLCNNSKLEVVIREFLILSKIDYKEQFTWDWLKFDKPQHVDFFLPKYNVVIEAQGIQHFKTVEFFDKNESFDLRWSRDINKRDLCIEHGIKVYYYSSIIRDKQVDEGFEYPYKVFEDIEELFKTIKEDFDKESLSD